MLEITAAEMAQLVKLTENEGAKARIQLFLDELPEKIARLEAARAEAEQRFREREEQLQQQKKRYRECESEIQMKQESIKKSDVKLLSIKNNKEYHAVLKEIEELQAAVSRLEDEMLEILFVIEQEEQGVVAARKEWEVENNRLEAEKQELETKQAEQEATLTDLDVAWKKIAAEISGNLMDRYLEVRRKVPGGNAVAAAKDFVCQGCYMNIPPQMYNELYRMNTLRYCPFCHRMLYYGGNNGEKE